MPLTTTATIRSFGGHLLKLTHPSTSVQGDMSLNLYLPPQALLPTASPKSIPILFYLSGLTCTGDNCAEKGFLQATASKRGIAIVYPDTSPRGAKIEGEDDSYDFGTGAGFYVDATRDPWSKEYRMYSYVVDELPGVLGEGFEVLDVGRMGITGHSMGGHGALTLFLKNSTKYKSVSAFAPIANPINAPWGQKAFTGYFGPRESSLSQWTSHDATELLRNTPNLPTPLPVLIDVGTGDNFYKQGQLLPENFEAAAKKKGLVDEEGKVFRVRYQEGYDHSYYFVASFAEEHVGYHADILLA